MKQKKVLFVATVASHIQGFHEPYLKLLHDNGYIVYVAAKNNLPENSKINHCDIFVEISIERSPYKLKNIKAIKELKEIIEKEKFDLIHCHTPMGSVVTRLAAKHARKKYGTRVIYTAHGFHFYKGAPILNWLLFYPIEKYLAKYTDTLITINQEDHNLAKKKLSKRCKNIEYVPGVGIDEEKFNIKMTKKEKIELRKSLGLKEDDFVLIYAARMDKNKNQSFLIKCMEKIVNDYENIHLILAGADEVNGMYHKLVDELKLNNNIHFLGIRRDIPELLKISNIVVSASKREGLPVNIMEAIASNVPVVALNCRGMEDLITNGVNGFIVDNENDFIKKVYNIYKGEFMYNSNDILNIIKVENIIEDFKKIYFDEL